jgi:hypothetical protein
MLAVPNRGGRRNLAPRAVRAAHEGRPNALAADRQPGQFLPLPRPASRPPVGAVMLEAPSVHQARKTAVVRRLAPGVPFGEGLQLSAKMMTTLPPTLIGRMMFGAEAAELILQLVEGRRRPKR